MNQWVFFKNPGLRWLLASCAVAAAWLVLSPEKWIGRNSLTSDLHAVDSSAVQSLEDVNYFYSIYGQKERVPVCPGASCPVVRLADHSPESRREKNRFHFSSLFRLTTTEAWRGTMFVRWETTYPDFVKNIGDPVAFDFYGMAGKSWRFFVEGVEVAKGRGGPSDEAVVFKSMGIHGQKLQMGFEIDVGRSLAPGLITVSQPFLSNPSIASKLRATYRGMDRVSALPMASLYMIVGMLAAFGCFFTPFYKEILAFSLYITFSNWSQLLNNDLAYYPSFLNVDMVTVDSMIRSVAFAAFWSFWGLYFRVKSKLMWLPVGLYLATVPFCYVCGRFGVGLDYLALYYRAYLFHLAILYTGGAIYGMQTLYKTRNAHWAKFRRNVAIIMVAFCCFTAIFTALSFASFYDETTREILAANEAYRMTASFVIRGFIVAIGIIIALEWSLIVRDRQLVLQRFGTIVDPRLMNDIIRGPEGHSKRLEKIVVLFVDLRSFTKMCEVFSPDLVTKALNEYLDVVTSAVQKHGGVVDKFVGDAVMALWGVPEKGQKDSLSAVEAAMDIRLGMAKLNRRRSQEGQFTLNVGIGIHSGSAIFGAIGNGARVDHTVIGPTINIASRLQGLTRTHQIDIILSYELYQDVKGQILIEDLGMAEIRGMVRQVGHVKLIGLKMANGQFVIGSKILESAVNMREPGMVQNTPPNVIAVEYSDEYSSRIEDRISAA